MKNFNSVKEMLNWLIDNEGEELKDGYGRKWTYKNYSFYFKDLGDKEFSVGIDCLHLYKTINY